METISKNFSLYEFEHSSTAQQHHIDNTIPTGAIMTAIGRLVRNVLQPLRDSLGAPVLINSGYRCKELNELLGGVKNSQHTKGEAADIWSAFFSPADLAGRIVSEMLPFDQLIIYPTFVHVSHKANGVQRGQIIYDCAYKGEKI